MDQSKFVHVPNGVEVQEWYPGRGMPASHAEVLKRLRSKGQFVVGYCGGHNLSNALDDILSVASALINRPVEFVLVGEGSHKTELQDRVIKESITNVTSLLRIPKPSLGRDNQVRCDYHLINTPLRYLGKTSNPTLN